MASLVKFGEQLLSGNEAIALGAYHAGVRVAAAYPGTPSTEILETLAQFQDIYAEWSTNEKVAMELALGASYAGVRALASMKHVGLNVAADPFLAASTTGVDGGLVVVSADDPGIHSSQGEQDNRHYARLAKVPMLEPTDSQEAYDLLGYAFEISERFDTPVLFRTTTRISHSKSVVRITGGRPPLKQPAFKHNIAKYVMLPAYARLRRPFMEGRMAQLAVYSETFPLNQVFWGKTSLGIVANGVAYQYAREVFPDASFFKLCLTHPLPQKMIREFASKVAKVMVIEEIDPFLEETIRAMGIEVTGKTFIPVTGELNPDVIEEAARSAGILGGAKCTPVVVPPLPKRPPLLCPGCPHTGIFFVLNTIAQRSKGEPKLVITGDIGCYTLGTYPPLSAMDTCACMGASIGQAMGMEKAGIEKKVVAIIGDSTFMHSGITPIVDAVYNDSKITVIILDNSTTAMTGHQEHPGTGITAQGKETKAVKLEELIRGAGVNNIKVVDAFDIKSLRAAVRSSLESNALSVIIVRGACSVKKPRRSNPRSITLSRCDECGVCLRLGCPAIQRDKQVYIDNSLCVGDACTICEQLCPHRAINVKS